MNRTIVITSINEYTEAVEAFAELEDWQVLYVGDKKSPALQSTEKIEFYSWEDQVNSAFESAREHPFNHYCRKNIGYLHAIENGAEIILDTDDDNTPYDHFSDTIRPFIDDETIENAQWIEDDQTNGTPAINIYAHYTEGQTIWPRGLSLESVQTKGAVEIANISTDEIGVVQGLVDSDPDVDAIHRLIFGVDADFKFNDGPVSVVKNGTYSPFNSQNTLWSKSECFPLLYLPSTVTFRFTDILRGYVAQRCLWAMGYKVAFTPSSAYQYRNVHDYYKDLVDEVPCYTEARQLIDTLNNVDLSGDAFVDILTCYKGLEKVRIVQPEEVTRLSLWLKDLKEIMEKA